MKGESNILQLFRSTRLKRILPILIVILIPAAYKDILKIEVMFLFLIVAFIYSASSIFNAYKDNDYDLPSYFPMIILILLFLSILMAMTNYILLIGTFSAIVLGYIYNTHARFIVFGDGIIAGLTHYAIPILISSLLVGLDIGLSLTFSSIFYLLAISIGPITNLKDIEKDKILGYKTIVTLTKNPYAVSITFLNISFILIFVLYIMIGIESYSLLSLIPIFLLEKNIETKIQDKKSELALNLLRLYLILSFMFLIILLTTSFYILLISSSILLVYLLTLRWKTMM